MWYARRTFLEASVMRFTEIDIFQLVFWIVVVALAWNGHVPWWFVGLMALHSIKLVVKLR